MFIGESTLNIPQVCAPWNRLMTAPGGYQSPFPYTSFLPTVPRTNQNIKLDKRSSKKEARHKSMPSWDTANGQGDGYKGDSVLVPSALSTVVLVGIGFIS